MSDIMTVKEAREIMGEDAANLTDEAVAKLIDDLDAIAHLAIHQFIQK